MSARQPTGSDDGRSSPSWSNTIWSSIPPSSQVSQSNSVSYDDASSSDQLATPLSLEASFALSLDHGLVDSAVLSNLDGGASRANNFNTDQSAETELDALSFYSSSSISSCSMASIPDHSPHLFTNIGRALYQLSENDNDSVGGHSTSVNDISTYLGRGVNSNRCTQKDWWTKFQTEEDWEAFAEMAAQYIGTLVSAELMEMESDVERDRDPWRMKEASGSTLIRFGCQRHPYSITKMWLHRIYQAIAGILGANPKGLQINRETQMKMNYISYLVKELGCVQQRLSTLPPIPPELPAPIALGELPEETRNLISRRCSAWRAETRKERELLELKQSNYREEILSAIIETEEELFWSNDAPKHKNLGSSSDGYFLVAERDSPYWNDVDDDIMLTRRKCNMGSFRFLIALTAGAAGIASFLLQSKRR